MTTRVDWRIKTGLPLRGRLGEPSLPGADGLANRSYRARTARRAVPTGRGPTNPAEAAGITSLQDHGVLFGEAEGVAFFQGRGGVGVGELFAVELDGAGEDVLLFDLAVGFLHAEGGPVGVGGKGEDGGSLREGGEGEGRAPAVVSRRLKRASQVARASAAAASPW